MSFLHDWRPDLRLHSSLTLSVWVAAVHLVLLALLPFWQIAAYWRLFIAFMLLVSWAHLHRKYVLLRATASVKRIFWCDDGWMLETVAGIDGPFVLSNSSRIASGFVFLQFQKPSDRFWARSSVPVLKDSVDADIYRYLQIFLRWQRANIINPAASESIDVG